MTMPAALADAGMEPGDYEMIQQARQRVDEVNQRLARRGSWVQYAVILLTITPKPGTAPGEILESSAAQVAE